MTKPAVPEATACSPETNTPELSRRRFLQRSAVVGAAAWLPAFRIGPADAAATCAPPPNFPAGLELYQQAFENWSTAIHIDDLWTCSPRSPQECVDLANWAAVNGWRLRPRGAMHNWSPIHVTKDVTCNGNVLMVSITEYLNQMTIEPGPTPAVRAQAGVFLEDLLGFLEQRGFGMTATPAPGDVTVGGVLAVDAHGTAIPAEGEQRMPGHTYGSLSNLILSLTAIVWDGAANQYVLRTYDRSHPHCKALLVHVGRAFITEAVLQVGSNYKLRCQSYMDISIDELLAAPGSRGRTFESYLRKSGRAEVIWFPFTDKPWLKVWTVTPKKPLLSREVTQPYNYPFSDNIPREMTDLAQEIMLGNKAATPQFGQMSYTVSVAGLVATGSADIWGDSKNLLLYIKPSTLRAAASGYAVMTKRANIQQTVHDFLRKYRELVAEYEAQGEYPTNMPVEIRVTGLDTPADVDADAAEAPILSAIAPNRDHPEWDVAVWFDCLSFVDTDKADEFNAEMERWFHTHFDPEQFSVAPEWSKGWGYTAEGAWTDGNYISATIPAVHTRGRTGSTSWQWAVRRLDQFDPYRVFSNDFLDRLLR